MQLDIDIEPTFKFAHMTWIRKCSSVVHKVALYGCGGAQCRSSKPTQTDAQTDRKPCI